MSEINVDMEKILSRIRKMLAMANDKANINESAVAAAMAEKLMRKYQIEMSDVLTGADGFGAKDINEEFEWWGPSKNEKWQQWILTGVCKANDCHAMFRGYGLNRGIVIVGVGPDPVVAMEMYQYLTRETLRLAKGQPRASLNSFKQGCGNILHRRLKELAAERKKQFAAASTGKDLVIHKAAILEAEYGKFSYSHSGGSPSDAQAYANGQAAGAGINLSEQITGAGKHERLN